METIHLHISYFDYFVFQFTKYTNIKSLLMKKGLEKYKLQLSEVIKDKEQLKLYHTSNPRKFRKLCLRMERFYIWLLPRAYGTEYFESISKLINEFKEMQVLLWYQELEPIDAEKVLALNKVDRQKILEYQSAQMLPYYETNTEWKEWDNVQDLIEY